MMAKKRSESNDLRLFRDRVVDLRRVRAGDIKPNPRNWRTHPDEQREALKGILGEVGFVDALIARELPDGTLELVDGHCRRDLSPFQEVPVLVVDLSEAEADKVMLTFDPLSAMAEADKGKLQALMEEVQTGNQELAAMLDELAKDNGLVPSEEPEASDEPKPLVVIAQVTDEEQQRALFDELTVRGFSCRLV